MTKKIEKELRKIAEMEIAQMSEEQCKLVETLSAELGIEFNPNTNCAKCYADQAILILKTEREKTAQDETKSDARYILRAGVDVLFMGRRINAETITDEFAEYALRNGFPKRLFAVVPNED